MPPYLLASMPPYLAFGVILTDTKNVQRGDSLELSLE